MRAFTGLIPDPVANRMIVETFSGGTVSAGNPFPMTGLTSTSPPANRCIGINLHEHLSSSFLTTLLMSSVNPDSHVPMYMKRKATGDNSCLQWDLQMGRGWQPGEVLQRSSAVSPCCFTNSSKTLLSGLGGDAIAKNPGLLSPSFSCMYCPGLLYPLAISPTSTSNLCNCAVEKLSTFGV
jgi:hypothetical protein